MPRDATRCHEMLLLDVIIKAIVHLCPPIKNDGTATFILDHVLLIATSILEYHQIMIMIMSITHLVFGIAMGFSEIMMFAHCIHWLIMIWFPITIN